ncbi:hypothetical protein PGQ11_005606 [Apiospora arundinis]|uniref:Uncharacterized protein n=1 Tax=Apiospora arundinis TaxID=335852 RepID=A0ABR2JCR2_9PEZI
MAKYMAHPDNNPNPNPPTAPRAAPVRPENYSRWHLTGFSFWNGDPMQTNNDVRDFLQKPAFMPWRKSRGEVDSFLRFDTTLRVLFEAVVFFQQFWGQRGFWSRIRTLLHLDTTVSADTLEDTVSLYCEGRRNCTKWAFSKAKKHPSRIAELACIVDELRPGEHAPISSKDWNIRAGQWRGKLYQVLCDQGVHSQQVAKGTCAPELLDKSPTNSLPISPRSDTYRRDRFEPRQPSSPLQRQSLEQPRRSNDDDTPQRAQTGLPPKPPPLGGPAKEQAEKQAQSPTDRPNEQAQAAREDTTTNGIREKPADSTAARSRESPKPTQSLDELVSTYKDTPALDGHSRKRSRDEPEEKEDAAPNKRLATNPAGDSSRIAHTAVLAPIVTGLGTPYETTPSRFELVPADNPPPVQEHQPEEDKQKSPQEEVNTAGLPSEEDARMDICEVNGAQREPLTESTVSAPHHLSQINDDDLSKVADRIKSPDAESDSLFVEMAKFPVEEEDTSRHSVDAIRDLLLCLERRQHQLEKLEESAETQKTQLEQWAADKKRLDELESRVSDGRAEDGRKLRTLQKQSEAHDTMLKKQAAAGRRVEEKVDEKLREVKTSVDKHITEEERARTATTNLTTQLQRELQTKYTSDEEFFRLTNTRIGEATKQIVDAGAQTRTRFQAADKRTAELEQQVRDAEKRLRDEFEQHANACKRQRTEDDEFTVKQLANLQKQISQRAGTEVTTNARLSELQKQLDQRAENEIATEARLAELQRQLGQVQEALQAREVMAPMLPPSPPPPTSAGGLLPNGVDTSSLPGLDTGTFLDTMYFEMSKLRTAMRTRIRALDTEGVPDEDGSKLAVSDISFELGRVLEVARKRINKL